MRKSRWWKFSIYKNCSRVTAPHPSGYNYGGVEYEYSEGKNCIKQNKVYPHVLLIIGNCEWKSKSEYFTYSAIILDLYAV